MFRAFEKDWYTSLDIDTMRRANAMRLGNKVVLAYKLGRQGPCRVGRHQGEHDGIPRQEPLHGAVRPGIGPVQR